MSIHWRYGSVLYALYLKSIDNLNHIHPCSFIIINFIDKLVNAASQLECVLLKLILPWASLATREVCQSFSLVLSGVLNYATATMFLTCWSESYVPWNIISQLVTVGCRHMKVIPYGSTGYSLLGTFKCYFWTKGWCLCSCQLCFPEGFAFFPTLFKLWTFHFFLSFMIRVCGNEWIFSFLVLLLC